MLKTFFKQIILNFLHWVENWNCQEDCRQLFPFLRVQIQMQLLGCPLFPAQPDFLLCDKKGIPFSVYNSTTVLKTFRSFWLTEVFQQSCLKIQYFINQPHINQQPDHKLTSQHNVNTSENCSPSVLV